LDQSYVEKANIRAAQRSIAIVNSRVKIVLLGLMVWAITFMAGFIVFVVFGAEVG